MAGTSGAIVAGLPLLTTIAGPFGWRAAFVALALLAGLTLALVFLLVPPDDRHAQAPLRLGAVLAAYAPLLGHRPTLGLLGWSFLSTVGVWTLFTYIGTFFLQHYALTSPELSLAYLVIGSGVLLGSVAAGGRLGRLPARPTLIATTALLGLLRAGVVVLPLGALGAALLLALTAVGTGMVNVVGMTLLVGETPAGRATTTTVNQAAMSAAMGTGATLGGLLVGLGGFPALALSLPLLNLAAALLVWLSCPVTLPAAAGMVETSATAR